MASRGYELNSELYTLKSEELVKIARRALSKKDLETLNNLGGVFNLRFLHELKRGDSVSNNDFIDLLLAITESKEARKLPISFKFIDIAKHLIQWNHLAQLTLAHRSYEEQGEKLDKIWDEETKKLEEEIKKISNAAD